MESTAQPTGSPNAAEEPSGPTLLTSLGTGNYVNVTYQYGQRQSTTSLVPVALAEWFQPTKMIVLLTQQAMNSNNWQLLREKVPYCQPAPIPEGRSEEEYWEIFDIITSELSGSEEVILDITHGFRSLPVIVLLAAVFLHESQRVKLRHIFYGAFEARDVDKGGPAPIFDLSPLLDLVQWAVATNRFRETGDARKLGDLLQDIQQRRRKSGAGSAGKGLPSQLKNPGRALSSLSQAIDLVRPKEICNYGQRLVEALDRAKPEIRVFARPFELVREQVQVEFGGLKRGDLASQRDLIKWYLEHGRLLQALIFAREWVISWTAEAINCGDLKHRGGIEDALNQLSHGHDPTNGNDILKSVKDLEASEQLRNIWNRLSDLRNDLAHCGFRSNPRHVNRLAAEADEIYDLLGALEC
jgi:CRISPR-associated DxTHG motif protein